MYLPDPGMVFPASLRRQQDLDDKWIVELPVDVKDSFRLHPGPEIGSATRTRSAHDHLLDRKTAARSRNSMDASDV